MQDSNENSSRNTNYSDLDEGAQRLKNVALFRDLSHESLKLIYSCGSIKAFKTTSHILIEGETSHGLYIILEGKVSIHKSDSNNQSMHLLAYLEEGNDFGELSLLDDAPRSATVIAEMPCKLFYLDAADLRNQLEALGDHVKADFYEHCAREIAYRLRVQNSDYIIAQKLLWKFALRNEPASPSVKTPEESSDKSEEDAFSNLSQKAS